MKLCATNGAAHPVAGVLTHLGGQVGLLEQARTRSAASARGPMCSVQVAMQTHPTLAADIIEVIRDRQRITDGAAAREFEANGIDISKITVDRHRQNNCGTCKRLGYSW